MAILSGRLPSIKQLQCFVAVAQELNFRRAAERLSMSQPPLSRQIKSLEELLRVKLIERDTHSVSLTSAGEAFEREAHRILAALDAVVASVREERASEEADIRLGLTSVIDFSLVAGIGKALSGLEAAAQVRVERAYSRHLLGRVCTGELDLAIVGNIPDPGEGFEVRSVARDPLIVALPEGHEAARRPEVSFRDLEGEVLFWFPRHDNPVFYDRCERTFAEYRYEPPRRPEPVEHVALLSKIAAGEGVAFFPASMRAASRLGVAYRRFVPELEARLNIELQLVWRVRETRPEVHRTVQALLAAAGA